MDIEKNIKAIRAKKGLLQKEVAEKMKLETPNYNRLEKKGNKTNIEQLQQIAKVLGVTLKEVLFGESENEQSEALLKLELEREKLTNFHFGILNHLRNINTYLPSKPVNTDIGEYLQPNDYKMFLTYRGEINGKSYTLAHWEKRINKEASYLLNNGHQDNIGKRLLNGSMATSKEREHAQIIQDTANQHIKTDNNLWAIHFINIEEFFKAVFKAIQ